MKEQNRGICRLLELFCILIVVVVTQIYNVLKLTELYQKGQEMKIF